MEEMEHKAMSDFSTALINPSAATSAIWFSEFLVCLVLVWCALRVGYVLLSKTADAHRIAIARHHILTTRCVAVFLFALWTVEATRSVTGIVCTGVLWSKEPVGAAQEAMAILNMRGPTNVAWMFLACALILGLMEIAFSLRKQRIEATQQDSGHVG